jgi:hypothetical protein
MDNELRIKQLHQAYNELESHIKQKHSFYMDDPNCFKMRQEQSAIMRELQLLEIRED